MAETIHFMSARHINQVFKQWPTKSPKLQTSKICPAAFKKNDFSLITKKSSKSPRRLITISTSDGRWHTNWSTEYLVSLQDLQLEDLVEDEHKDANVSINLTIQKVISPFFLSYKSIKIMS
ncbi:hypothetical protein Patl1_15852 [Pistacia atlantica]|uniref:Uncharacterized protein n=1 Tax=Pistacia atlantica TaxID=434234 RepID=A0ACC1BB33_9ROSI|nr:hypothetical protein Patl1_15852 [Pistacia atlantica]